MLLPEYGELKKDFHCQRCCKHLVLWRAWPYAAMLKSVCPWWNCACLSYLTDYTGWPKLYWLMMTQ